MGSCGMLPEAGRLRNFCLTPRASVARIKFPSRHSYQSRAVLTTTFVHR
jgi:hypothetical protein